MKGYRTEIKGKPALVTEDIYYFGRPVRIICDMNCAKAFGFENRPKVFLTPGGEEEDYDDHALLADDEVPDQAPDPQSWEGGEGKPNEVPESHNKWCARACERSTIYPRGLEMEKLTLKDFTKRRPNCMGRTGYEKDPE